MYMNKDRRRKVEKLMKKLDKLMCQRFILPLFYLSTVLFCVLLAFCFGSDGRYYSTTGSFSICLPGDWTDAAAVYPETNWRLFPEFLPDLPQEQISLININNPHYTYFPQFAGLCLFPKQEADKVVGASGVGEFYKYMKKCGYSSPMFADRDFKKKPDYSIEDFLRWGRWDVMETCYYTDYLSMISGPGVIMVVVGEIGDSYYIFMVSGEYNHLEIPLDKLESAVDTIRY